MTAQKIDAKLLQSDADILHGRLLNQEGLDHHMKGEKTSQVYIRAVCTKERDSSAHLKACE